ncbi:unnamed protein product, partial [marine sediment metagenome]
AMKELGVTRIFGPNAAGSLSVNVKPGEFVICDQYVDRTSGRKFTFYDGPKTTHVSYYFNYCFHNKKYFYIFYWVIIKQSCTLLH